jgi:hypothetical protein
MSTYFLNSFPGLSRRDDKKIYTIEQKEQGRRLEQGQDELIWIDGDTSGEFHPLLSPNFFGFF